MNMDEQFYEKVCRAYIDSANLEWVAVNPENNDSIVHGYFADDETAEKWGYGDKINSQNFKEVAYDGYEQEDIENGRVNIYEYETWEDFYEEYVKSEIEYDIQDIGIYSDGTCDGEFGEYSFYLSKAELLALDLLP